jgi:hypothetical protein
MIFWPVVSIGSGVNLLNQIAVENHGLVIEARDVDHIPGS